MNKYKICIYAICKNEEKYIDTWYNSVKEADKIFILDTGSTDNTFNLLKDKEKVIFFHPNLKASVAKLVLFLFNKQSY